MDVAWRKGLAPEELTVEWTQAVQKLFLEGTGEQYFAGSIQSLPVPRWDGNLMLFDSVEETPQSMRGLLWTTPFKEDTDESGEKLRQIGGQIPEILDQDQV